MIAEVKSKIDKLIRTEKLAMLNEIIKLQTELFNDSQNSKDRSAFYEEYTSYENGIEDCLSRLTTLKDEMERSQNES